MAYDQAREWAAKGQPGRHRKEEQLELPFDAPWVTGFAVLVDDEGNVVITTDLTQDLRIRRNPSEDEVRRAARDVYEHYFVRRIAATARTL